MSITEKLSDFVTNENYHVDYSTTSEFADFVVNKFIICRKPVEKILLQIISKVNNSFEEMLKDERYTYDKIFHLYLIIELIDDKGIKYYIKTEKSPRITFEYSDQPIEYNTNDYYEIKAYNFTNKVTFKDLCIETKELMGALYDDYNAFTNNCQNYILSIIKSYFKLINIRMPEVYEKYIYLPIPEILKKHYNENITTSISNKISKFVTDLGRRFNSLIGKGYDDDDIYTPLSSDDIKQFFNNRINIVKYSELDKYKNVEDLFNKHNDNNVIILFEISDKCRGHWTALKLLDNQIYFFDSYGFAPEDELDFKTEKAMENVDLRFGKLLNLLIRSNKTLNYNEHKLQNIKNHKIATCGRWASVYLKSDLSTDEFENIINIIADGEDKDELICKIYDNIINNNFF